MRQSLGLSDKARPSAIDDPQRLARQAIRSQAAAREYAERHIVRAEVALVNEKAISDAAQREAREARAIIQDLRDKLAQAKQRAEARQAQRAQEHQARIADDLARSATLAPAAAAETGDAPSDAPVKRKRGRPPGKRDPSTVPKIVRKTGPTDQAPVTWWTDGWTPRV